jgi:hypothetical protein
VHNDAARDFVSSTNKNNNPKSTTRTMRVMRAPLACPAASLVIVAPPNPD